MEDSEAESAAEEEPGPGDGVEDAALGADGSGSELSSEGDFGSIDEDDLFGSASDKDSVSSASSVISIIGKLGGEADGACEEAAAAAEGAGGVAAAAGPMPLVPPGPPGVVEFRLGEGAMSSSLIWYTTDQFYAYCRDCGHGARCCKNRIGSLAKGAHKGRPLGFLYWWIQQGSHWGHALDHAADVGPSWIQRRAARDALKLLPGSEALFRKERKQRLDEPDSEPDGM